MGVKDNDRLKQSFLLAFVIVGIILIGFTWADGLRGSSSDQPGYVRPSLNRLTPAAEDGASQSYAPATHGPSEQTPPLSDQSTPVPADSPHTAPTLAIVDEDQ